MSPGNKATTTKKRAKRTEELNIAKLSSSHNASNICLESKIIGPLVFIVHLQEIDWVND